MSDITTVLGIHAYDGYAGESFWKIEKNKSTYNDVMKDNQCHLQLREVSKIREEVREKYVESGEKQQ